MAKLKRVRCKACGKRFIQDATSCPHCGEPYDMLAGWSPSPMIHVVLSVIGVIGVLVAITVAIQLVRSLDRASP